MTDPKVRFSPLCCVVPAAAMRSRSSTNRMVLKTVEGALPVFEMRRESDAGEREEGASAISHVEEEIHEPERESDAQDSSLALEEPGEDDEFDDVGMAEQEEPETPAQVLSPLPASLAAMPLPASPSMIPIRHKQSRSMKRADSESHIGTPPNVPSLSSQLAAVAMDESNGENGNGSTSTHGDENGAASGSMSAKKRTKKKVMSGDLSSGGLTGPTSPTSSGAPGSPTPTARRGSGTKKKRGSAGPNAPGSHEDGISQVPPPLSPSSSSQGDQDATAASPPSSLPPPLASTSTTTPNSSPTPKSKGARGPIARSASALPPGTPPPPPPPMPVHLSSSQGTMSASSTGGVGEERTSTSGEAYGDDPSNDELPPPMIGAGMSLSEEIAHISFQRRTSSLAVDGFSTLRDSFDGSETNGSNGSGGPSSPGGADRRPKLKRRQSSRTSSAGSVVRKRHSLAPGPESSSPGAGHGNGGSSTSLQSSGGSADRHDRSARRPHGSTRPRMMDGIIRIVKSMYDGDGRSAMDSRIFTIEAKEYPDNVVYVDEDEEATEDYNLDFPAIKSAIVEKLILGLTPEAYADPDFNFAFLLSFHSFTTPQKLCDLLKVRWTIPLPQKPSKTGVTVDAETFQKRKLTPIRLRIINVIKLWLEEHRKSLDAEARTIIEKFINEVIKPDMAGPAASLLRLLKETSDNKDEQIMFDEKPPKPYLPMNLKTKLSILDVHPEEIARQITLIDSALYRKIKPAEFLNSGWTRADKDSKSPGIVAMISSFNVISRWVSTQILSQPDLKQRAITLNRIICVAQHCYEYNNFNGVMEIIASLHNSSIHRLYNTWELLPQKSWDMFEFLSTLMNSNAGEGNFHLYRNALRKVVPPLVPYLGVYLTDLIFLNDGNKDFVDDAKKMVNFHKMAKIARVVRTITTHQQAPYCLAPVEFIQDFLLTGPFLSDDEQYVESCKLEKKVPKSQRSAASATSKPVKKIKVDFKALNIHDD